MATAERKAEEARMGRVMGYWEATDKQHRHTLALIAVNRRLVAALQRAIERASWEGISEARAAIAASEKIQ